ncbi:MAG: hypothetical protein KDD46_03015 [Bdellovibrionales bacterium]|nr:hypothetical protein [Bdellovibrionales bacterium]
MNEIKKRIDVMLDRNKLHHAFFFVGAGVPTHQEKLRTAFFMATKVFSKSSSESEDTIEQRIQKKYHPDFFHIDTSDQEIKIDQIQELIKWIYRGPVEGTQKFAFIEHAQRLNINASNALLKILEEPPSHATLILCSPSKDQILQTLRSRMFILQFSEASDAQDVFESPPSWFEDVERMVLQEKFDEKVVFETTQSMGETRSDLLYFFHWIQHHLKTKIASATNSHRFSLYCDLFEQTLSLEQQIYKRYGNVGIQLDRFFIEWGLRVH